jgi:phosphohistidine phosphatase
MRRLLLLRHARAEPAGDGPDFDRALTAAGRADARTVGAFLAARGIAPGLALLSPARRAAKTWELARAELSTACEEKIDPRLYDASAGELLEICRRIAPRYQIAALTGHNPGLEALALALTGNALRVDTRYIREKFSPGALAAIDFDVSGWDELNPAKGVLAFFVTPASAT